MRDERIDIIRKIIAQNDDEVLQSLFPKAADAGISSAVIIRVWHGRLNLERQPKQLIDFLADALNINGYKAQIIRTGISDESIDLPEYRKNKLAFMEDETVPASTRKRSGALFESLEPIEYDQDRDVALMSKAEVIETFEALGHYNRQHISSALSVLNKYFEWSAQTKRPVSYSWISGDKLLPDDIDVTLGMAASCYADPYALRNAIEERIPIDQFYVAPPAAVLAWMGFNMEDALSITNSEVDLLRHTIRGRQIPDALYDIIIKYYHLGDGIVERKAGYGMRKMYIDDIGLFLKAVVYKPRGKKILRTSVAVALHDIKMSYKDIQMSSRYYDLHQIAQKRAITNQDICDVFDIKPSEKSKSIAGIIDDRLVEYYAFVKVFHQH